MLCNLTVGMTFPSISAARQAVEANLLLSGKSKIRGSSGGDFVSFKCKGEPVCKFEVKFYEQKDGTWITTHLSGEDHNGCCHRAKPNFRQVMAATQEAAISASNPLSTSDVQRIVALQFGANVSRHVAHAANTLRKEYTDSIQFEKSFSPLLKMITKLSLLDPKGIHSLVTHPDGTFRGVFIMQDAFVEIAVRCKAVYALDAAHLHSDWEAGRLFLCVAQDMQKHNIIVALAIMDAENYENYCWFLQQMKLHRKMLAFLTHIDQVIISDRSKGLISAVSTELPEALHMFCTFHLLKNVNTYCLKNKQPRLNHTATGIIWAAQAARSEYEYLLKMTELERQSPAAYAYLTTSVKPEEWCNFCQVKPTYGIRTNNLVEQTNSWAKPARAANTPFDAIRAMLTSLMDKVHTHRMEVLSLTAAGAMYFPLPNNVFQEELMKSSAYVVRFECADTASRRLEAYVQHMSESEENSKGVILLQDMYSCSCRFPALHRIPCRHVLAVADTDLAKTLNLDAQMNDMYLVAPFLKVYNSIKIYIPLEEDLIDLRQLPLPR